MPRLPARNDRHAAAESLPPVPAPKPKSAKAGIRGDPALDAERFAGLRRDLRRLVAAEETYYAENGIYTDDLGRVGRGIEGEGEVRFLWATRDGWAVRATHPDVPGRDCIVWVGRGRPAPTTARDRRSASQGVPVCDGLPPAVAAAPAPAVPGPATNTPPTASAPPPSGGESSPASDTASALDAVNPSVQMRVDLRNLVRSQDTYFAMQGIYAKRTGPLALQYAWHKGVTVRVLGASDESWSAEAVHNAWPGKSCVIWVGPVPQRPATAGQHRVPTRPGTAVCDD